MKKILKVLSLILSLVMLVQIAPASVWAIDPPAAKVSTGKSASKGMLIDGASNEFASAEEQNTKVAKNEDKLSDSVNRMPSAIQGEINDLRNENTKHYRHEDGTFTAAMYAEPVHFKDAAGNWNIS